MLAANISAFSCIATCEANGKRPEERRLAISPVGVRPPFIDWLLRSRLRAACPKPDVHQRLDLAERRRLRAIESARTVSARPGVNLGQHFTSLASEVPGTDRVVLVLDLYQLVRRQKTQLRNELTRCGDDGGMAGHLAFILQRFPHAHDSEQCSGASWRP